MSFSFFRTILRPAVVSLSENKINSPISNVKDKDKNESIEIAQLRKQLVQANEIAERYLKYPIPPHMVGLDMDSCMYKMRVNCWNWNSFFYEKYLLGHCKHLTRSI